MPEFACIWDFLWRSNTGVLQDKKITKVREIGHLRLIKSVFFSRHFMKQSTKLLSLVLALVMAFSCMTVIGNAASTVNSYTQVEYDSIDYDFVKKNK